MIWDWGWNWKDITVINSKVAIDATSHGDKPDNDTGRIQGTAVGGQPPVILSNNFSPSPSRTPHSLLWVKSSE
jgi:hypothetical protein